LAGERDNEPIARCQSRKKRSHKYEWLLAFLHTKCIFRLIGALCPSLVQADPLLRSKEARLFSSSLGDGVWKSPFPVDHIMEETHKKVCGSHETRTAAAVCETTDKKASPGVMAIILFCLGLLSVVAC
jgi:hypothetical protein